jgi:hypothetical protein
VRSGEGGWRRWCGFNVLVSAREGDDGTKRCRKMKRRQRACLGSMERKRDTARWRDTSIEERWHRGGKREETTSARLTRILLV